MHRIKSFIRKLKAFDLVVVIFFIFLNIINIVFHNSITPWSLFLLIDSVVIFFAFALAFFEDKYNNRFWRILHYWYIAPLILFTFKELYFIIHPVRVQDYDQLFIKIDHWIFGVNPTQWLHQFANPALTELLQIVYGLFYFLPIILALVLLRNKRYLAVDFAAFSIIYGFFLSYLGYFALPGVGPRFTLHNL